jgi:hypothetical protein
MRLGVRGRGGTAGGFRLTRDRPARVEARRILAEHPTPAKVACDRPGRPPDDSQTGSPDYSFSSTRPRAGHERICRLWRRGGLCGPRDACPVVTTDVPAARTDGGPCPPYGKPSRTSRSVRPRRAGTPRGQPPPHAMPHAGRVIRPVARAPPAVPRRRAWRDAASPPVDLSRRAGIARRPADARGLRDPELHEPIRSRPPRGHAPRPIPTPRDSACPPIDPSRRAGIARRPPMPRMAGHVRAMGCRRAADGGHGPRDAASLRLLGPAGRAPHAVPRRRAWRDVVSPPVDPSRRAGIARRPEHDVRRVPILSRMSRGHSPAPPPPRTAGEARPRRCRVPARRSVP